MSVLLSVFYDFVSKHGPGIASVAILGLAVAIYYLWRESVGHKDKNALQDQKQAVQEEKINTIGEDVREIKNTVKDLASTTISLKTQLLKETTGKEVISKTQKEKILVRIDASIYVLFNRLYESCREHLPYLKHRSIKENWSADTTELERSRFVKNVVTHIQDLLMARQAESRRIWSSEGGIPTRIIEVVDKVNAAVQPVGLLRVHSILKDAFDMAMGTDESGIKDVVDSHVKAEKRIAQIETNREWIERFSLELQEL